MLEHRPTWKGDSRIGKMRDVLSPGVWLGKPSEKNIEYLTAVILEQGGDQRVCGHLPLGFSSFSILYTLLFGSRKL